MSSTSTRIVNVSESNIKDQVAALMYAWGIVNDNQRIVDLRFGTPTDGVIPVEIDYRTELEVTVSVKKGDGTQL